MAKRILVPLDQSQAAEAVVPLIADAARGGHAVVRLLHVAPKPESHIDSEGRTVVFADQEMYRLEAEGLDYLRTIELQFTDVPVEYAVRFGDPVSQILQEAEEYQADLIALSTTGRNGLRRALLGSVAEQVFKRAGVPVLMMHA